MPYPGTWGTAVPLSVSRRVAPRVSRDGPGPAGEIPANSSAASARPRRSANRGAGRRTPRAAGADAPGRRAPRSSGELSAPMYSLLLFLWIVFRRWLAILWVRLNKWLVTPGRLEKVTPLRHKLLVLGDGYAEGLGDWVMLFQSAGLTGRLQRLVAREPRLRQHWRFVNLGRSGTVTGDWLNAANVGPGGEGGTEGLLYRRLQNASLADAEVVVVIVGAMDVLFGCDQLPLQAMGKDWSHEYREDELAATTKNIIAICEYLRAKGKHVILADIPQELPAMKPHRGRVRKLNRQIRQYVRRVRKEEEGRPREAAKLRLVAMTDGGLARAQSIAFDGTHLNRVGYARLAELVLEEALPLMVSVELPAWFELMAEQNRRERGAGEDAPPEAAGREPKKSR